jgi:hypothetical protein
MGKILILNNFPINTTVNSDDQLKHFSNVEAQELHIEYWANGGGVPESGASAIASTSGCAPSSSGLIRKESSSSSVPVKCSIKTAFRALAICRMPDALPSSALCLQFVKEKKKEKSKSMVLCEICI